MRRAVRGEGGTKLSYNWKLISYLMAFLAGVEWGREHPWLCLALVGMGVVSYWFIKHGTSHRKGKVS